MTKCWNHLNIQVRLGLVLLLVAVLVVPVSARVFQLFGHDSLLEEVDTGLDWGQPYQAQMKVNGRQALMWLYAVRSSVPAVAQLRQRLEQMGAAVTVAKSEDGATGVGRWPDGRQVSFIVMTSSARPQQQIFIYQPEGEKKSQEPSLPRGWGYPQGTPKTLISNEETGTWMATLESSEAPVTIQSYYAGVLTASGWEQLAAPALRNGRCTGMAVYQKKGRVCFVQASEQAGRNLVTLLVKKEGL